MDYKNETNYTSFDLNESKLNQGKKIYILLLIETVFLYGTRKIPAKSPDLIFLVC